MEEGERSTDGGPLYRIDIIFDGDRPDGKRFGNLIFAVNEHFRKIRDEHLPRFKLLTPEDAADYYASR